MYSGRCMRQNATVSNKQDELTCALVGLACNRKKSSKEADVLMMEGLSQQLQMLISIPIR